MFGGVRQSPDHCPNASHAESSGFETTSFRAAILSSVLRLHGSETQLA